MYIDDNSYVYNEWKVFVLDKSSIWNWQQLGKNFIFSVLWILYVTIYQLLNNIVSVCLSLNIKAKMNLLKSH